MLKRRVIMTLLFNDGVLFRTKKFVPDYRYTQTHLGTDFVDEVFLIDITRSGPSQASHTAMAAYAEKCFVPITMGGHIRSLDDVANFMAIGADKVVVERAYLNKHTLLTKIAEKFGAQAVVAGIKTDDAGMMNTISMETGPRATPASLVAPWLADNGAGEIFLQSYERDGSLSGYDLDTLERVVAAVRIPVVVGTSCGSPPHMKQAFDAGASGAATANIFHMTDASMRGFKASLAEYVRPI